MLNPELFLSYFELAKFPRLVSNCYPPASASQIAETSGIHQHAQFYLFISQATCIIWDSFLLMTPFQGLFPNLYVNRIPVEKFHHQWVCFIILLLLLETFSLCTYLKSLGVCKLQPQGQMQPIFVCIQPESYEYLLHFKTIRRENPKLSNISCI